MKTKSNSPGGKRRHSGMERRVSAVGTSAVNIPVQEITMSMTPDTFNRSQTRLTKKAMRKRRSLNESYDPNATTQMFANYTDGDDSMMDVDAEHTPITLSQISCINPLENDTLTTTFAGHKRHFQSDPNETWEMAVEYARGEPDGAERSFARRQLSQISLHDEDEVDGGKEEEPEAESDAEETLTPAKRSKLSKSSPKALPPKAKKGSLKVPLKQAVKKLKLLKSSTDTKGKKQSDKNFEALPDETTVPKTPNQTWKEKKKDRKMLKNNYNLITSAKKAWEDLRRADLPNAKKQKLCDDLSKLVAGKVKELSMVHDSARVIQCLVQYGNEAQRVAAFEEIQEHVKDLCKSKYGKFVIRKLIHYGSKELRAKIFACFHGHVRKLIRHKEASEIIEYAFNEFATAPQRMAFLEEFYGPSFSLFKDQVNQSLGEIMADKVEKKETVIRSMKEALSPLIDKEILSYSIVHKVFFDFFTYADEKAKKDMIENLRDHIPHLLHTRDGTRVAMQCIWSGSVKDRKMIVKSLKTHMVKVCKEEHGHLLLLAIFDTLDDTILVQKALLEEMFKSLDVVVNDQHGKKVLQYLMSPRDPTNFHPDIVKILSQGDGNSHSKKDKDVRIKELRSFASPHLLKYLEKNAETMMVNSNMTLLVKAVLTQSTGDVAPAMRAISDFVAKAPNTGDGETSMVEHPACHIALKKIIANDKARMKAGEGILFSAILLEALPKSTIKVWAASNRGCFMLLSILEVGCSTITEKVIEQLKPVRKSLSRMTFKGAELLIEKLDNPNAERTNADRTKEFRI